MLVYDFEVFKYNWLVVIMDTDLKKYALCIDNPKALLKYYTAHKNDIWVGYNSRSYDQYILKGILLGLDPYELTQHIIQLQQPAWMFSTKFGKFPLLNFDVMTDISKGLKQLEGFMGNDIKETSVPFNIDRTLTDLEIVETVKYCKSDVENTMAVFMERIEEFNSQIALIRAFDLNIKYISMTKPQLSAIILGARKKVYMDEFEIDIVNTIKINKYKNIVAWYQNRANMDYKKYLSVVVAGVKHSFGYGGLHGAREKYIGEGIFINSDVGSFYPSLMIQYDFLSRNVSDKSKYKNIYDTRMDLKRRKLKKEQAPYKLVLNSTFGASKDKNNNLYDPLQANNVCINGQLMLLDLIEKLEDKYILIQSNTDGVMFKLNSKADIKEYKAICSEWEKRTRMSLEHDIITKVIQKDVNNYLIVMEDGSYKSKGAYLKKLDNLDYDLPILNIALREYFLHDTPIEDTIKKHDKLIEFQKIVKITGKYKSINHNGVDLQERCARVFASKSRSSGPIKKISASNNLEKIGNTPEKCFIDNSDIKDMVVPRTLDKNWYVDMAIKRLSDFGISNQMRLAI
jgi:hypothetical protein